MIELFVLIEKTIAFGPVNSSSTALNRTFICVLDLAFMFEQDGCDLRWVNDWFETDIGQHETSSSICYLHLVLFKLVCIGR